MKLVLIDVWEHTLIKPKEFLDWFGHLNVPTVVYEGILDHEVIAKVRENQYGLKEGLVFKTDKNMFKLKLMNGLSE
jgi:hypothetical protein